MTVPEVYRSTSPNIEGVPMTNALRYSYWSGYSVVVPALKAGDVVQITAQFECNNPNNYAAQVTHFIGRGEPYGRATLPPQAVDPAFPVSGADVAAHGHYRELCFAVDQNQTGDQEYSLIVETASTAYTQGAYLIFNKGYGGIVALVFRA